MRFVGGDLTDSGKVLSWLTSEDVFATGDEIEEVNRHMLDKLLSEDDFVAVYFCKYTPLQSILRILRDYLISTRLIMFIGQLSHFI